MKWFHWPGERRQWQEKRKKNLESRAKAEMEERERDRQLQAKAKKQLLPIEWLLGINLWNVDYHSSSLVLAGKGRNDTLVTCFFYAESVELEMIAVGSFWDKLQDACAYWVETKECDICDITDHEQLKHQKIVARALFCLGVDDPDVLTQFDSAFSQHEKRELRLSMPREFWPQKWLDEEATNY